jgi:hypothetical protein
VSGAAIVAGEALLPARREAGPDQRTEEPAEIPAGRLLLRFAVGAAELGIEGLAAALRQFEVERLAAPPVEPPAPLSGRHVVIGALCDAPAWLAHQLHPTRGLMPVRREQGRWARLARLARRAPGVAQATRYAEALEARGRAQLARWAELGAHEEQAGREIARLAIGVMFENAMSHVAESPELKQVIEEQSQGLTRSAMNDIRETSARADRLVESVARRLLGRRAS